MDNDEMKNKKKKINKKNRKNAIGHMQRRLT